MDLEGIYEIVKQGNEFNKERFNHIENFIKVQNTVTRARVEEVHDSLKIEIKCVEKRQNNINGSMLHMKEDIRAIRWIKKHPLISIGIFLFMTFIANFILSVFTLKELIKFAF